MKKHGYGVNRGKNPTYRSWEAMKYRCTRPSCIMWHAYGGRGISYDERWKEFANFLADMGPRPTGMTLDRIDPNGNYGPDNCRWADRQTQNNNRSTVRLYEYRGSLYLLSRLAEEAGISPRTLRQRINRDGMTVEDAVNRPLREVRSVR